VFLCERPQVSHSSTNPTRSRVTSLIETNCVDTPGEPPMDKMKAHGTVLRRQRRINCGRRQQKSDVTARALSACSRRTQNTRVCRDTPDCLVAYSRVCGRLQPNDRSCNQTLTRNVDPHSHTRRDKCVVSAITAIKCNK